MDDMNRSDEVASLVEDMRVGDGLMIPPGMVLLGRYRLREAVAGDGCNDAAGSEVAQVRRPPEG